MKIVDNNILNAADVADDIIRKIKKDNWININNIIIKENNIETFNSNPKESIEAKTIPNKEIIPTKIYDDIQPRKRVGRTNLHDLEVQTYEYIGLGITFGTLAVVFGIKYFLFSGK
jgi:hypothetical protein